MAHGIHIDTRDALRSIDGIVDRLSERGLKFIGQKIASMLTKQTQKAFKRQADPTTGEPWKPRAYNPSFHWGLSNGERVRRKAKQRALLVQSGALKRGARGRAKTRGNQLVIQGIVGGPAGTFQGRSTNLPPARYAAAHQFGAPSKNIPARPYFGMSKKTEQEIADFVQRYIVKGR